MKKSPKRSRISTVTKILDLVPGKARFGVYRFLPFFFLLGASLEFSMINWTVGTTNFYQVYKRKQAQYLIETKNQGE